MENYICTENETVFYDGGRAFTDDLLNFAESNAGDEIFERIIET